MMTLTDMVQVVLVAGVVCLGFLVVGEAGSLMSELVFDVTDRVSTVTGALND